MLRYEENSDNNGVPFSKNFKNSAVQEILDENQELKEEISELKSLFTAIVNQCRVLKVRFYFLSFLVLFYISLKNCFVFCPSLSVEK